MYQSSTDPPLYIVFLKNLDMQFHLGCRSRSMTAAKLLKDRRPRATRNSQDMKLGPKWSQGIAFHYPSSLHFRNMDNVGIECTYSAKPCESWPLVFDLQSQQISVFLEFRVANRELRNWRENSKISTLFDQWSMNDCWQRACLDREL